MRLVTSVGDNLVQPCIWLPWSPLENWIPACFFFLVLIWRRNMKSWKLELEFGDGLNYIKWFSITLYHSFLTNYFSLSFSVILFSKFSFAFWNEHSHRILFLFLFPPSPSNKSHTRFTLCPASVWQALIGDNTSETNKRIKNFRLITINQTRNYCATDRTMFFRFHWKGNNEKTKLQTKQTTTKRSIHIPFELFTTNSKRMSFA